jgi:hypothetical protein
VVIKLARVTCLQTKQLLLVQVVPRQQPGNVRLQMELIRALEVLLYKLAAALQRQIVARVLVVQAAAAVRVTHKQQH